VEERKTLKQNKTKDVISQYNQIIKEFTKANFIHDNLNVKSRNLIKYLPSKIKELNLKGNE